MNQASPNPILLLGALAPSQRLAARLGEGGRAVVDGSAGSSTALLAAAVARATGRPAVLVTAHVDDADATLEELTQLGAETIRLPAIESLPGETAAADDLFAERLAVMRRVLGLPPKASPVIVAPIHALMQPVPRPDRLEELSRELRVGAEVNPAELLDWLDRAGYRRVAAIEEQGDLALRGGILDIYPAGSGPPVRIDFFGDEIERIFEVDLDTMGSDRAIDSVDLVAHSGERGKHEEGVSFLELVPERAVVLLDETMEIVEQGRGYYERAVAGHGIFGPPAVLKLLENRFHALAEVNRYSSGSTSADERIELPVEQLPELPRDVLEALKEIAAWGKGEQPVRVIVLCGSDAEHARLKELLEECEAAGRVDSLVAYMHRGFMWRDTGWAGSANRHSAGLGVALIPYHELLHRYETRRRLRGVGSTRSLDAFLDFDVGDYVVHAEHGIARFSKLEMIKPKALPGHARAGEAEEYLTLEFEGGSKLHVPATRIDLVQKYVGGFKGKPPLSTLGGVKWKHQKQKVAESVMDLAAELLRVRAAREASPGTRYPGDTAWQKAFEAEFPFEETEDQLAAIAAIKEDMVSARPMDRLICGDVGFGKTEIALRAAFKAAEAGKQVAFLVPTTLLAVQHERTVRERFADYPFRVDSLTRFKTGREVNRALAALRKGEIDVMVGTHRLLSKDVRFADLGLVVVDEEQRFGVEHKEGLLRLRATVDVLTLSATPIPRTLHMAMLGLRDISNLTTAPADRRAIVTEVIPYNAQRIRRAIDRELSRGGQIFFVHNRVHNIKRIADDVRSLAPAARIVVGHGQMASRELEEVMLRFVNREADILVSTTIIESGIDIPSANTMFINDADRFGLADLHQLRGRVGRSKHRAYCYMLLPAERSVNPVARKRLKAIEQFSMLGAGFKIAMRDLEIRGAGNLLGAEQSGHIAAVGYEMYCQLLDRAVADLKNERRIMPQSSTSVDIGLSGSIPRPYIPSDKRRLTAYRRIATADTPESLRQVEADLTSAYGDPPRGVRRLLDLAEVRVLAAQLDVRAVVIRKPDVVFRTRDPQRIAERLKGASGSVRIVPAEHKGDPYQEVYFRPPEEYLKPETLLAVLRRRLADDAGALQPADVV